MSADPTALPAAAAAAVVLSPSVAVAPTAQPSDITEIKPRRSRSGMFRRPSLADMLSVPEPGVVPPVGGVRVAKPVVAQEVEETAPAEELREQSSDAVDPNANTLIHEPEDIIETVLIEPTDTSTSGVDEMEDDASHGPPAIQVPVSAIAVDVPDPSVVPDAEPTDAPPGFESSNRSLDDSWFGQEDEFEISEDTQPMAEGFIEDPGFADVTEPSGFDEIPWANDSMGGASFPRGLVLGAVGLVAAVVLAFFMMSGDKPAPTAPPATVAQVQAPPPRTTPPPPPQPVVPPPEEVEGADSETMEADSVPDVVEAPPVPSAPPASVPAPPTARQATPVQPKPKPKVVAAKTAKAKQKPKKAASPWAPKNAKPVASAPPSNPWGNPDTAKRGRINITSNVKARVFLDGKNIGNTPTSTEADFGPHTVKAEVKGYHSQTKTVNVQSGEVKVPFSLQQSVVTGRCNVLGTSGDVVVMDGRNIGKLPQIVDCVGGKHSFKVTPKGGGAPYTKTFESSGDFTNIILRP